MPRPEKKGASRGNAMTEKGSSWERALMVNNMKGEALLGEGHASLGADEESVTLLFAPAYAACLLRAHRYATVSTSIRRWRRCCHLRCHADSNRLAIDDMESTDSSSPRSLAACYRRRVGAQCGCGGIAWPQRESPTIATLLPTIRCCSHDVTCPRDVDRTCSSWWR